MTTFVLALWPVLTLILVLRLPFPQAILLSLVGGYLLLPTEGGIDFPILPPFNKRTIPGLALLVILFFFYRARASGRGPLSESTAQDLPGWLPHSKIALLGLGAVLVGSVMTALTNGDRLVYGRTTLPAMQVYDGLSLALTGFTTLIPLILGRKFFAHPDRHRLLLRYLVMMAVGLSILALYEVRMSPQLNRMVYGFFPHSWQQHVRSDGFRPIVFMNHGLQLAMFFAMAFLAALGLYRTTARSKEKTWYLLAGPWLLGTIFLSNSLGAFLVAAVVGVVVFFLGTRLQMLCAAAIAALILTYPVLRTVDVVPTESLVSFAASIEDDRARSLRFRFVNEDILLDHVRARPVFGWGSYDRGRVFDEEGRDTVTIDGLWISILGQSGGVGYFAFFGFMALPVMLLVFSRARRTLDPITIVLCLAISAALIDMVPNGFLSPVTMLIAGGLWGRWETCAKRNVNKEKQAEVQSQNDQSDDLPIAPGASRPVTLARSFSETAGAEQTVYSRQRIRHQRLKPPTDPV